LVTAQQVCVTSSPRGEAHHHRHDPEKWRAFGLREQDLKIRSTQSDRVSAAGGNVYGEAAHSASLPEIGRQSAATPTRFFTRSTRSTRCAATQGLTAITS